MRKQILEGPVSITGITFSEGLKSYLDNEMKAMLFQVLTLLKSIFGVLVSSEDAVLSCGSQKALTIWKSLTQLL